MAGIRINVDDLWNADEYWHSGMSPWTIFAYPASLADSQRLPRDGESRRYLAELVGLGVRIGIWEHPEISGTIYFACPFDDRDRVHSAIQQLEQRGTFPPDFASRHCEYLFAASSKK